MERCLTASEHDGQAGQHVADLEVVLPARSAPVDLPGKASTPAPRSSSLSQAMKQRTIQVHNFHQMHTMRDV